MTAPIGYYEGIGGSVCAAIMGLDKNKSPYDAWRMFTDPESRENLEDNEPVQWGQLLEKPVGEEAARRLGIEVVHNPELLKHQTIPFMQAHVDFGVTSEKALLEVKCRGLHMLRQYDLDDAVEMLDEERVLPTEAIQVHHYLTVTELPKAYLAVLIGGQRLLTFTIHRDPDICAAIEARCIEFWDHVQRREPPPPINLSDCAKLWPDHKPGSIIQATPEIVEAVGKRKALKATMKGAKEELDFVELRIKSFMKESEELRDGNTKLLTLRTQDRAEYTVAPSKFRVMR